MDSSRRAVESYWRSRMIDAATSDEDKVTPVYKLEEICQLLRSSHVSLVKEISEFILKRLDHKSPIVKQKALRLIKYAVGKSGVEFRREMQRHSVAVRQLFHYKGQLDPLKGDALNKAVRDIAHETISAIFAEEESKSAPAEDLNKRIQGFGNTNFEMLPEDKKSFLSEVVGLGSASIKQGLTSITAAHSLKKNDNGSYRSPNLRRSLTTERDDPDKYERFEQSETRASSGISKNLGGGPWGQDSGGNMKETTNGSSSSSYSGNKTREERLLETIVTSGGVRLQPTRDAIQTFLVDASKLDAMSLSHALESKLQSPVWQVRMKAVCVLESVLRKKDGAQFSNLAIYFSENKDSVVRCSESPQASLREKANKVLSLLDGEQNVLADHLPEKPSSVKDATVGQMPDLIDTGDVDDFYGKDDFTEKQSDQGVADLMTSTILATDDLFGDSLIDERSGRQKNEENDPFADVSFHTAEDGEHASDLFSGLTVDDKQVINDTHFTVNKNGSELLDIFGPSAEEQEPVSHKKDVNDILAGFSTSNGNTSDNKQQRRFSEALSDAALSNPSIQSSNPLPNDALNGLIGSQMVGMSPNAMFPLGPLQYGMPPNIMFNPAFASQTMNYGMMGNYIAQQQLLATMSNFQQLENLSARGNVALGHVPGNSGEGGYTVALPDIFHPNVPIQPQSTLMNNSKKEETKAFDFISDHLSAARGGKRVL
ncbi:protein MODIFIED TRANSPORT TO THE VACUOLE 1-like [Telopea speciosissima]|uniref:protein MODIFIED TRANSPORT TO THE VACUOLE 1-like n=1 Tax=Telopea speciosissima TaxID=54955 RepID=UPI001CC6F076|nr:protein MODIFIED TRANSPORT TO THE VACUOLE 1-like [Telopea speciosissima]